MSKKRRRPRPRINDKQKNYNTKLIPNLIQEIVDNGECMKKTITPHIAWHILQFEERVKKECEKNGKDYLQRKTTPRNYGKIMWYLRNDRFVETPDSIAFTLTGHCVNGLHRIRAIYAEGKPGKVLLSIVPIESYYYIDTNSKGRTLTQSFGTKGVKNASTCGAAAGLLFRYLLDPNMLENSRAKKPPHIDLLELFLQKHPEIMNSIKYGKKCSKLIPTSLGTVVHFLLSRIDAVKAHEFMEDLANGANLPLRDPVLYLRNFILDCKRREFKFNQKKMFAVVTQAWNLRVAGRKAKPKWREGESYPFPTGLDKWYGEHQIDGEAYNYNTQ